MDSRLEKSIEYASSNFEATVNMLSEFIAIPSVSSLDYKPAEIQKAVEWIEMSLGSLAIADVRVFDTSSSPIVFAQQMSAGDQAPTVLIYAHYDVQPADQVKLWDSEPFRAKRLDDYLYGRGSSDMKGQFIACAAALEAIQQSGPLPVNIKFLIEGNEETTVKPVATFIENHGDLLDCDHCLVVDAGMLGEELPAIVYGLRGSLNVTLRVSGPEHDLHDGMYGGVIENPSHVLVNLIAGIQDEQRRITLPGFYDDVPPISTREHRAADRHPFDESHFLLSSGAPALIPDKDYLPVERIGARPSFNTRWIEAGSRKNAIPFEACARLSFRLVPNQDPSSIYSSLVAYINENAPESVTCSLEDQQSTPGVLVATELDAVTKMCSALTDTWGVEPVLHRIGGAIPVVSELKDQLGIESVLTGFSLPGDNIHGQNERVHLPTLRKGVEALIRYFFYLSN